MIRGNLGKRWPSPPRVRTGKEAMASTPSFLLRPTPFEAYVTDMRVRRLEATSRFRARVR